MPAKRRNKDDGNSPTPVPDDPDYLAKREAEEKRNAEARRCFEDEETIIRARIEAMERVDKLIVDAERERRLDPEAFAQRTAIKGPARVNVKLMTGNRAIAQQNFVVTLPEPDVSILVLKVLIRNEAMRLGHPAERFAPSAQRLFAFGKDLTAADEQRTGIRSFGVGPGSTIQMALAAGSATTFPPQVTRPRLRDPSPALSPSK